MSTFLFKNELSIREVRNFLLTGISSSNFSMKIHTGLELLKMSQFVFDGPTLVHWPEENGKNECNDATELVYSGQWQQSNTFLSHHNNHQMYKEIGKKKKRKKDHRPTI